MRELADRAARAVELAKRAGADDAWAVATHAREVGFTMRNGALEEVSDGTSRGLELRLFVDGRYSAHATTDLRLERVEPFVREAVALTRALQPDEHRAMPDPARFPTSVPDLALFDPAVAALEREQRLAWCKEMNERVVGEPRVVSATSAVGDAASTVAVASTNGFEGAYSGTTVSLWTEVTLEDGARRPEDSDWAIARHLGALPNPATVGAGALERARARLGSEKGATQRATLVVDRRAAARLLSRLLAPASGSLVQQQRSFWRGRLGEPAVSELLTVVDDPLRERGLASRPFDREGFAAQPLPIVEGGRLRNLYLDTYYANKLRAEPTTGVPSNRVVSLGERGRDAILASLDGGLYVTDWLGGNADTTSGDFSFGARGHRIGSGALGAPVSELNLTGNLLELFSRLVEVGDDPWEYGSLRAPTLVFDDVEVSGV